jgi:RND family efflux transporter MFP subunit
LVLTTKALVASDTAALENLKVQQSYYTIKAPISGRIGVVALKEGAVARQSETTGAIVTINQLSPIYVSFSVPQSRLPELREAMASGPTQAYATPQGSKTTVEGKVAVIDNAIDVTTGAITARALFDNPDETLWPGQFCSVRVQLRIEEDAVVIPREAVQNGQNGQYVFVAEGDAAKMRPVVVSRILDEEAVISKGLQGSEKVVIDGQAMLTPNARIAPRGAGKPQAGPAPSPAAAPASAKTPG